MLKCIIVEDEKLAQDVLKKYISLIPTLKLIDSFNNASDAFAYIHDNEVDLIFLDINMPQLSGIDFLKTLPKQYQIIITTAYSEHALEGYEYSVCDYLLKPIRYERFLKAINKVLELNKRQDKVVHTDDKKDALNHIFIKEDHIVHKVFFKDLLYVEAFGNYVKIYTREPKPILARITLTEMESQLPTDLFLRVHKSYIVAINAVDKIETTELVIAAKKIPLGATYRQEIRKKFRNK